MSARTFLALLVAGLGAVGGSVQAQTATYPAPNAFNTYMGSIVGPGKWTVGFGSDGTPLVAPSVPNVTLDGGKPLVTGGGSFNNPSGARVPVTFETRVPPAKFAEAFGKFAAKAFWPVTAGTALYDFAKEMGYFPTANPAGGAPLFNKADPAQCYSLPCPQYASLANNWYYSITEAAEASVGKPATGCSWSNQYSLYRKRVTFTDSVTGNWRWMWGYCGSDADVNEGSGTLARRDGPVTPNPTYLPGSMEEFLAKVAAKSGFPSTSNIVKAAEAAAQAVPEAKVRPDTTAADTPTTVTGPAVSPGTETVTKDAVKAETTTTTTTHPHTYGPGPLVTTDTKTVKKTTKDATGEVVSETTETTEKTETPQEKKEGLLCGIPGTPPCNVKVDEGNTPTTKELKLDEASVTAQANTNKTTIGGTADKGFFDNWGELFVTPPVVACTPLNMPASVGGVSLDPCPVVSGARTIMAWLWALAGFWVAMGWIREAV